MYLKNGFRRIDLNRIAMTFLVSVAAVLISASADAQDHPIVTPPPSHDVRVNIDSGVLDNDSEGFQLIWSDVVFVKDAQWTRLHFGDLVLTSGKKNTSVLRITSLEDGAFQILRPETAIQWRNTSAYFNGDSVRIELFAHAHAQDNRVSVEKITVGEVPDLTPPESICDTVDDRVLSNDVRCGRTSGGCTAWLFDDRPNCMITAGHCAGSADVVYFNVPLSDPNGSYNFPSPDHQYAVDESSKQLGNSGIGEDWCYFGCFDNANTGLSPFAAQGASFQLVQPGSPGGGDQIRITGYGTTSSPVDPTWNGAQKTHVGPYSDFFGTTLRYRTDTTGGNSGSPVILESTGQAIGVHSHAGCSSGGTGANHGTGFNHPAWQNAINNPLGICVNVTPPSNDEWNNTIFIADPDFSVTGTNVNATVQADEQQLDNTGSTVWWFFDTDEDGTITIDTFGSNYDTQLHIYTDFELGFPNLTPVVNNDDAGGTLQSQVTFQCVAFKCYEIRVGGYTPTGGGADGAEGDIVLNATFVPDTGCPGGFAIGDVNQDGVVNLLDVEPFIGAIGGATYVCEADINEDGIVNLLDVDGFISLLGGP